MSRMSDLSIEIQDRLANGEDPKIIAKVMEIPIVWVYSQFEVLDSNTVEVL